MSEASWIKEFYPVPADKVPEENAIQHSLVKWYGLRKENISQHSVIEAPIWPDGESCALCVNYAVEDSRDWHCGKCPLKEYLKRPCFRGKNSVYEAYIERADPEPMIAALEAIAYVEKVCK